MNNANDYARDLGKELAERKQQHDLKVKHLTEADMPYAGQMKAQPLVGGGVSFISTGRAYVVAWDKVNSFDDLCRIFRAMRMTFYDDGSEGAKERLKEIRHMLVRAPS